MVANYCASKGIKAVLLFRFSVENVELPKRFVRVFHLVSVLIAKKIVRALNSSEHVTLCSDSFELASKYEQYLGTPVDFLPIPQQPVVEKLRGNIGTDKKFRVGVLGPPRHEKGFDLSVDLIARMKDSGADYIEFHVQTSGADQASISSVSRIQGMASADVVLYSEPLSTDEYLDLLQLQDVLLLPYRAEQYGCRTSGVLNDAVTVGTPVIAVKTPWIEEQFRRHLSGVLLEGELKKNDLMDALHWTFANYKFCVDQIEKKRSQFLTSPSPNSQFVITFRRFVGG